MVDGRQRVRTQRATDTRDNSIPWRQHTRVSRKPSACVSCNKHRIALGEVTRNSQRDRRKKTRYGCQEHGVAICNSDDCWYLYHTQNI
ncbi:hypothetical protein LZ31DRAFT_130908 [Colletotrichum somersetense]|nr:hypothetical protein LZ31DRAFT_130908 [Colletotrichum somersetense]